MIVTLHVKSGDSAGLSLAKCSSGTSHQPFCVWLLESESFPSSRYPCDYTLRLENVHAKQFQIKPFVWRAFQGSVVKIHTTDFNVGCPKNMSMRDNTDTPTCGGYYDSE